MFTGIITAMGKVATVEDKSFGKRFQITSPYDPATIALGASIAHDGACMTVVETSGSAGACLHVVDVSRESLSLTTLAGWMVGTRINLERSLALGEEMGGHLVTGHVDGLATIVDRIEDEGACHFWVRPPKGFAKFVARKGSVALAGTSLTVNEVKDDLFRITLIPHTLQVTTWGAVAVGDAINFEVDLMARYVDRLRTFA